VSNPINIAAMAARATRFVFCDDSSWEIALERRERDQWAIVRGTRTRSHAGEWEHEPSPSHRDDAYLARCRWTLADAWAWCEAYERGLGLEALSIDPKEGSTT
jgi:hypothetical protein